MKKRRGIRAALVAGGLLLGGAIVAEAGMVRLEADADTTIFANAAYQIINLSNGMGQHVIAGVTGESGGYETRRALVGFDLAGQLPLGAIIDEAVVELTVSRSPPGAPTAEFTLHRATTEWGEGASDATGVEGTGTGAEPGDATWVHSSFPGTPWNTVGGDFLANVVSGTASVGGLGTYSFVGAGLTADVQYWVDNPGSNFGWFLLGDESGTRNARRFYSHDQDEDFPLSPHVVITYHVVPEPTTLALLGSGVVSLLWWRRRRH